MLALRRRIAVTVMGLFAASSCGASPGDPVEDSRAELTRLYTLSVAIDTCPDADLTDAEEEKLDRAISAVEAKLALTEEASEALYTQLSAAADNDKGAFCKEVVPTMKDLIDKLPD